MRPTPSHARYSLDHQERERDSCKRRQHSSHTHTRTHTELHPWAANALRTLPIPLLHSLPAGNTHSLTSHAYSFIKLAKTAAGILLARTLSSSLSPSPPSQLFSCCLYIGSQPQNNIFYIRSSPYIFLASVLFRFDIYAAMCCWPCLRAVIFCIWFGICCFPHSLLPFPACICLHFIDAKVLLTNLAKNAYLQWKLIHMRPWQWKGE